MSWRSVKPTKSVPSMQAGLAFRQLSFREIFTAVDVVRFFVVIGIVVYSGEGGQGSGFV
jgi:hypothetical protein